MKVKCVLFDFDGTLHDVYQYLEQTLGRLRKYFRLNSVEEVSDLLFKVHRKIVHKLYPDKHDDLLFHVYLMLRERGVQEKEVVEKAMEEWKIFEKNYWVNAKLFPEVLPILKELRKRGIKIGLVTCGKKEERIRQLKQLRIAEYFDHIITSDVANARKPSRKYYIAALQEVNFRAAEVLMVGDDLERDVRAREVGIKVAWLNRYNKPIPRNVRILPDFEISSLNEILNLIG